MLIEVLADWIAHTRRTQAAARAHLLSLREKVETEARS